MASASTTASARKFLHAGPGYGGSCFPKDTVALIKTGLDHGAPLRIVEAVAAVNDARKRAMARKVQAALGGDMRGKTIAVLGLTFKPKTDDMREAPSIPLITALQDMGAKVRAYDPVGIEQAKPLLANVTFCDSAYSCAEGASALVIVTEWEEFRALDFARLKKVMARPVLVDLRNVYSAAEVARHGFAYESVGRAAKAEFYCHSGARPKVANPESIISALRCMDSGPGASCRPGMTSLDAPILRIAPHRRGAAAPHRGAWRKERRRAGGATGRRQDHARAAGVARGAVG